MRPTLTIKGKKTIYYDRHFFVTERDEKNSLITESEFFTRALPHILEKKEKKKGRVVYYYFTAMEKDVNSFN